MKKLLAYTINGDILGIDINSWNINDLNGNDILLIVDKNSIVPKDYVDISSIENWHNFVLKKKIILKLGMK